MYILIDPQILENKGLHYYEKMPDGRAIAETNLLKVLGSVKSVEFVSTTAELNEMRKQQQAELDKLKPEPEKPQDSQPMADIAPAEPATPAPENNSADPAVDSTAPSVEPVKNTKA